MSAMGTKIDVQEVSCCSMRARPSFGVALTDNGKRADCATCSLSLSNKFGRTREKVSIAAPARGSTMQYLTDQSSRLVTNAVTLEPRRCGARVKF